MADLNAELTNPPVTLEVTLDANKAMTFFSNLDDITAPVVAHISPTAGSTIERTTPIVVDVTDETGLGRVIVTVLFEGNGVYELVHDGDVFAAQYSTSLRSTLATGFRYTLRRTGGWILAPTINVFPVDAAGNEDV